MSLPTREEAVALLEKYNDTDSLRRHGLAVEAVMRHFAAKLGEDPEYWGLVGLLHDVDYGKWPEEHLKVAPRLLSEAGFEPFTTAFFTFLTFRWERTSFAETLNPAPLQSHPV